MSTIAQRLTGNGRLGDGGVPVLVAPFLSTCTRERLQECGVGYVDLTGNVRVALDRPALFVYTRGTERDPRREELRLTNSVKNTVRQRPYERYESIVRVHIKPALGRVKLAAITPNHGRRLYRQKLDSGLSPASSTIST